MVKRVGIRIEETIYNKAQEVADSYGISVNTLMTFIIGSWIANASGLTDKLLDKIAEGSINLDLNEALKK